MCDQAKKKPSPEYLARDGGQKQQKKEQGIRCRRIFIWFFAVYCTLGDVAFLQALLFIFGVCISSTHFKSAPPFEFLECFLCSF